MTYTWFTVTASQKVSNTPACVGALHLTPKSTKMTAINIYDGQSTADPIITKIRTQTGATKCVNFQPYLVTKRGLYIECDGDIEYLLIQLAVED